MANDLENRLDNLSTAIGLDDVPVFRYKKRTKIEPDERTLGMIRMLASHMMSQREIAAILQISLATLHTFFKRHPEAYEAWEDGKELGRAQLRAILWKQAKEDPAQARFLAKQKDWLDYDEGRGAANSVTLNINAIPKEERIGRLKELQARLINREQAEDVEDD